MIKGFGMIFSSVDFGWTLEEGKTSLDISISKKVCDNIQISK